MSAVSKLSAAMGLALAAMGAPLVANGQVSDGVIKIGVLSDSIRYVNRSDSQVGYWEGE